VAPAPVQPEQPANGWAKWRMWSLRAAMDTARWLRLRSTRAGRLSLVVKRFAAATPTGVAASRVLKMMVRSGRAQSVARLCELFKSL
jgi:hypothetical protein